MILTRNDMHHAIVLALSMILRAIYAVGIGITKWQEHELAQRAKLFLMGDTALLSNKPNGGPSRESCLVVFEVN